MNEEQVKDRVQVLVVAGGLTYHWRAGNNTRLCTGKETGEVIPLKKAEQQGLGLCGLCARAVDQMSKGW